ncbi:hypothetical protein KQ874_02705 [Mycoplasma sp. ES3157-GEN-MYC]|uniref:hypothetical protein n=1 Tax=Mycoplasma miroungigenitalium TaxID=754515 RepID=UPI001C1175F7|nr:hypothetical protein [Mycoplasma miroungigenitalium]MBU4690589.1 hypothetical protein [Mycoplasma miroungigenitalium]
MKKRNLLLSLTALATVSSAFLGAACNSSGENVNDATIVINLKKELQSLQNQQKDSNQQKEKLESELADLKQKIAQQSVDVELAQEEVNNKIEEINNLQKEIDLLNGTEIETNNLSAKELFKLVVTFLKDDFPNAMAEQSPDAFKENKELFDKISTQVTEEISDLENIEENSKNVWFWQNKILFNLKRAELVAKYVDNPQNPVTITKPKSSLIDALFDWRINDISRIIEQVSSKVDDAYNTQGNNGSEIKAKLIENLNTYKKQYEDAKKSALLSHQISNWYKLENEKDGVIEKIINGNSTHQRSLMPQYKLSDFKMSLFPVYKKIVDKDFIDSAKKQLTDLVAQYKSFLVNRGIDFIYSVRYKKLFDEIRDITNTLVSATQEGNLEYFTEYSTKEKFQKFIDSSKETLFKGLLIDNSSAKREMNDKVDSNFNLNNNASLAAKFIGELTTKSNKDSNAKKLLFSSLIREFQTKIKAIFDMNHETFTQSFARYQEYLVLVKEFTIVKNLVNLHTDLEENIETDNLKNLLKWDNSSKYQALIESAKKNKERDNSNLQEQKTLIETLKLQHQFTNKNSAIQFIQELSSASKNVSDTFTKNFDLTVNQNTNSPVGVWAHMYGDDGAKKIVKLITDFNKEVQKLHSLSSTLDEQNLKNEIEVIINHGKLVIANIYGGKEGTTIDSFYGKFNILAKNSYLTPGDEYYEPAIKILNQIVGIYDQFISNEFASKDNAIKFVNDKLVQIGAIIETFKTITEYGRDWEYLENSSELKQLLNEQISSFKTKVEEFKTKAATINDESWKAIIDSIVKLSKENKQKFGSVSDNNPPIVDVLKETLDSYDNEIRRAKKKMENIPTYGKVFSGHEVYILLRYWSKTMRSDFEKNKLQKEQFKNDPFALWLENELKSITKYSEYKQIMKVESNDETWDVADPKLIPEIHAKFTELETNYAKALIDWFNGKNSDKKDELKSDLLQKREAYYTWLNELKSRDIHFGNKFIRFGADQYWGLDDNYDRFDAASLLLLYAKSFALSSVMNDLYEEYLK